MNDEHPPAVPRSGGNGLVFGPSDWVSLAVVLGGAALRILHWASGRSLWQDEAYLAVNVLSRDIVGLARPLELNQSAPYLFLAATDVLTMLMGQGERVLRLIPLLASLVTLVLFWRLGRKCLARWTVPVALAMISFLYPFVYYAQEFKQYSVEVLVVVAALWLLATVLDDSARATRRFLWLGAFGAGAIFLSHTAPFVLGGVGAVCLYARIRGQVRIAYPVMFVVGGLWVGLFALNYAAFIRPAEANALMAHYWAFAFPEPPWTEQGARGLFRLANEYVNYLGYTGVHKAVLAVLGAVGCFVALWRIIRPPGAVHVGGTGQGGDVERWRGAVAMAAMVGVACFVLAVALGRFPFYGRLALFVFPMGVVIAATGLGVVGGRFGWVPAALSVVLLLAPLGAHLQRSLVPIEVENQREVIARLVDSRSREEPVYVSFYAQPALIYYRSREEALPGSYTFGSVHRLWTPPPPGVLRPPRSKPDLDRTLAEIAPLTRQRRFWVLVSHMQMQEAELLSRLYTQHGFVPVAVIKELGAAAYRMERVESR